MRQRIATRLHRTNPLQILALVSLGLGLAATSPGQAVDAPAASAAAATAAPASPPAESPAPLAAPAGSTGQPAPATAAAAKVADRPQTPAEDLFARKCASCHTVGKGARVGPDLKNSHVRRNRAWLERFVKAPSAMLDSDPDARNLLAEFKGVRMPDLGIADKDVASLVDLIARCSNEPCNLMGKFTPVTTATDADVARGRAFFLGDQRLKNGAAPCISCHTVRGTGSVVAGGLLAKDLTNVFGRLGDEGLDRALASPAFPLMNKIFADHPLDPAEGFALRAFLYRSNLGQPKPDAFWSVLLVAMLGAVLVLVILNAAWARRLQGVRKPLTRREGARS